MIRKTLSIPNLILAPYKIGSQDRVMGRLNFAVTEFSEVREESSGVGARNGCRNAWETVVL